ncbi:MAG TPA: 50S ribosomal protein L25 [Desulfatiglandales bacterium]|nr:50S ribosomal protein L25 [Desulfatiglandales bacterium]
MAYYDLAARVRDQKGKDAAKRMRRGKRIPAIFYGPKTDSLMLTVDSSSLKTIMNKTAGENIILRLQIESDKGTDAKMVILKELVTDPIKDSYVHVDFHEISMDKKLTVNVPIRLINTPVGVANGGILQHVKREMAISCLPDKLLDFIEADVSNLNIGDSIHFHDIILPEGITSVEEEKFTVAVVIPPSLAAAEEVVEKKEEEGEEAEEKAAETEAEAEEGPRKDRTLRKGSEGE